MAKKGKKSKKHQAAKPQHGYFNLDDDIKPFSKKKGLGFRKNKKRGGHHVNVLSADDIKLRQSVESDKTRTIVDMASDGNCLFRSLSDQLFRDHGNNHADVRSEVCNFLEGHEEDFSLFLVLDEDEEDEDAADFVSYVDKIRKDAEWGGNLELVAAARLYRRNITVFSSNMAAFTIDHGSEKESAGPDLLVSYHDNDHYNSIRDSLNTQPPPPIRTWTKPEETNKLESPEEVTIPGLLPSTDDNENDNDDLASNSNAESPDFNSNTESTPAPVKIAPKLVKRSSPCPCGSEKRYKQCCWAKDKAARNEKRQLQRGDNEDAEEETNEMEGNFRVLKL